ncbi:MAG: DUF6152 family protein [Sphingobium sp.]
MKRAGTRAVRHLAVLAGIAATAAAGPFISSHADAHHSFAMFDQARTRALKGTVKEFRWVNPHVSLFVLAEGSGSAPELWAVELTSPGNLTRLGWNRRSFKPGDKVLVEVNPLRDGQRGGGFRKATLLDTGQVLQARLIDIEKKP